MSQPMAPVQQQQPQQQPINHQMHPAMMGLGSIEEQLAMEQLEMERMRNPMAQVAAHALLKPGPPAVPQHYAGVPHQNAPLTIRVPHASAPVQLESTLFESHQVYPHGHPAHYAAHAPTYGVPVHGMHPAEKQPTQYFNAQGQHYPPPSPIALSMMQRQQLGGMRPGHVYGSPVDGEDNVSVTSGPPGSAHGSVDGSAVIQGRARSGSSASGASGYTSPGSSYEMPSTLQRMVGEDGSMGNPMGMMMKHSHAMTPPVSAGGGGNMNGAFAAMMM
jgi:hypothetical protein